MHQEAVRYTLRHLTAAPQGTASHGNAAAFTWPSPCLLLCGRFFMHSHPDVMPVRTDEQFDYQAMQAYLHTHVAHAEGPLEVRQFGGGHANLTYLLRMGEQEWVLQRPPLGPTLPTAHDMRREFRVLS